MSRISISSYYASELLITTNCIPCWFCMKLMSKTHISAYILNQTKHTFNLLSYNVEIVVNCVITQYWFVKVKYWTCTQITFYTYIIGICISSKWNNNNQIKFIFRGTLEITYLEAKRVRDIITYTIYDWVIITWA